MKNSNFNQYLSIWILFFGFVIVFKPCQLQAQPDITWRVGLNAPSLSDDETNIFARDYKSNPSLEVAFGLDFSLSERLSVNPEIVYTTRSGKRQGVQPIPSNALPQEFRQIIGEGTVLFADFTTVSSPSYLDFPVILKYRFTNPSQRFTFFLEGGFQIGFLLNAKLNTSGNSTIFLDEGGDNALPLPPPIPTGFEFNFNRTENRSDILHKINYGIQYGLGMEYAFISDSKLLIDIRVAQGVKSIQKNPDFGRSKVGGVVFSIGYITPF